MAAHGYARRGKKRPEYESWLNAKRRCNDPKNQDYERYGGRGIRMCDEWLHDFEAFIDHIGYKPPGTSLDRIDSNKNYEPGNVRWSTPSQQRFNQERCRFTLDDYKTIHDLHYRVGVKQTELAKRYGVAQGQIATMIKAYRLKHLGK